MTKLVKIASGVSVLLKFNANIAIYEGVIGRDIFPAESNRIPIQ